MQGELLACFNEFFTAKRVCQVGNRTRKACHWVLQKGKNQKSRRGNAVKFYGTGLKKVKEGGEAVNHSYKRISTRKLGKSLGSSPLFSHF